MVDSKTLKLSISKIIKNPEMLRFAIDHLKTNRVCKKLPLVIIYVPDQV